jgi:hypothetical protein
MSKAKARRVDFSPDEYIAGVGGVLRADEQGLYWMICSLIMSEGGAIEQNDRRLAALCQIRPADARKIVDALVDKGKILRQSDGKLFQKRAQSEVEKSLKRIQTAGENGSNGGRPVEKNKQNQRRAKPDGFSAEKLTTNYQLPTNNQQPIEKEETIVSSKKRAVRLSADWQIPPDWIDEAVAEGLPRKLVLDEADRMKNWSLSAKGGAKLDWRAAWRNWYRDKIEKRRSRSDIGADGAVSDAFLFGRG